MRLAHLAGLAAVSAALITAPASANHSWNGYHWATTNKVLTTKVNAAVTSTWSSYLDTAISDWNVSANLTLTRVPSSVSRKKCSPIMGQILVCNDTYGQRGWLGIASIWLDAQGHINRGTTKLNDTYYAMARYNTPAWRRMVMCQEIGHDFGLAHQDETFTNLNLGSCMDYTNDPTGTAGTNGTKNNEHPNAHDYDELALIYDHADSYSTSSTSAATNFGIRDLRKPMPVGVDPGDPGDGPAEWGFAVHEDGKGRPDVFVMDLPGGGRKITHVFWALETKRSEIHAD